MKKKGQNCYSNCYSHRYHCPSKMHHEIFKTFSSSIFISRSRFSYFHYTCVYIFICLRWQLFCSQLRERQSQSKSHKNRLHLFVYPNEYVSIQIIYLLISTFQGIQFSFCSAASIFTSHSVNFWASLQIFPLVVPCVCVCVPILHKLLMPTFIFYIFRRQLAVDKYKHAHTCTHTHTTL